MEGDCVADHSSLSNCFVCYVCGELFKRPRILPCGHTFCSDCLAKLRDELIKDRKQDRSDQGQASSTDIEHPNGIDVGHCKTLTVCPDTETSPTNGSISVDHINNTNAFNGTAGNKCTTLTVSGRKTSGTCVDKVDNTILSQSFPPPGQLAATMSSSFSDAVLSGLGDKNRHSSLDPKRIPRDSSRRKNHTSSCERCPSIIMSTPIPSPVKCLQCGGMMNSQRSSSPPLRRSTSLTSTRDQSPTCRVGEHSNLPRWDNSSPNRRSVSHMQPPACSFEQKHGREMGQFECPLPQCNYSLRVMNLARWSPKNKTVANALAAWQRQRTNMRDSSTQTNISNAQSVLVTIPRTLVDDVSSSSLTPLRRRTRHSSMIDIAIDQAGSMDGLLQQPSYLPRRHYTWKSYAAMVGLNILQQVLNL